MITCTGCGAVLTTEPQTSGIGAGHVCPALILPATPPRIRIEDHIVYMPAPASREPYTEDIVDAYLARVDGVVVSATLMREMAARFGHEIVDESDRKAWVFRDRGAA